MAMSLIGILIFAQKRSLLSEMLAHTSYPGIVLGAGFSAFLGFAEGVFFMTVGALIFALVALFFLEKMTKSLKIADDAALCFLLASFFGIGIVFASQLQFSFPSSAKEVQLYLYGQAATMTEAHITLYFWLLVLVLGFISVFFKELKTFLFDKSFARTLGMSTSFLTASIFFLLVLSMVIGMRSVGIILVSGMFIAPAVAARQWTDRLGAMCFFSPSLRFF